MVPLRLGGRRGEARYQGRLYAYRGEGVGALAGLTVVGAKGGGDGEGTVWSVEREQGGRLVALSQMGEHRGVRNVKRGKALFCGILDSFWRNRFTGKIISEKGL